MEPDFAFCFMSFAEMLVASILNITCKMLVKNLISAKISFFKRKKQAIWAIC